MPFPKPLQDQLDDLALFPDRADRIEALVEIGRDYRNYDHATVPRAPKTRVPGCESEVFFTAEDHLDGTQRYRFAVDNPQGISAMALAKILESLSGQPPAEVAAIDEDVVFLIFGRELSMGKSLGLVNMVRMLKASAQRRANLSTSKA